MDATQEAKDKQLTLLKTVKVLRTRERLVLKEYLKDMDPVRAYRAVFPKVKESSAPAAASRFFKRLKEKLDDQDYLDEFNLGKPRLCAEIDRMLRATRPALEKTVEIKPGGEKETIYEPVDVPDNTTRLGALKLLKELHEDKKNAGSGSTTINIVNIMAAAYKRRQERILPKEDGEDDATGRDEEPIQDLPGLGGAGEALEGAESGCSGQDRDHTQ